jgi:transcriptional regulator
MYLPDSFREASLQRLYRFIDQNSLATIITPSPEGLHCSHVPVLLQPQADSPGVLQGHFARANPHACVQANGPTLCVFQGPHAYISPSWVSDRNVVPTWNYVAVHARGQLVLQHDPEWLQARPRPRPRPRPRRSCYNTTRSGYRGSSSEWPKSMKQLSRSSGL